MANASQLERIRSAIAQTKSTGSGELHVESHLLTALPSEIFQLKLKRLSFDDNLVVALPPAIGLLTGLEELYGNNNHLDALPDELFSLTALSYLSLEGNHLAELSEQVAKLTRLKEVHLSSNQLEQVPSSLFELGHLCKISLSDNQLKTIPPFGSLTQLQDLTLHNNQLEELPLSFVTLKSLRWLSLDNNRLSRLPNDIATLTSLEKLYVAGNRLSKLPEDFSGLSKLEVMSMRGNKISALPQTLCRLPRLKQLDIQNNYLHDLPNELGEMMTLDDVPISNNPFVDSHIVSTSLQGKSALLDYLNARGLAEKGGDLTVEETRKLIFYSQSTVEEIKMVAREAIITVALSPDSQETLVNAGGLDVLVEMMHSQYIEDAIYGSSALSYVSLNESVQLKIVEEDIIRPLLALLLSSNPQLELKRYVLRAVSNMCSNAGIQGSMIHGECIASLVALTYHDNLELKCEAVRAIANLAEYDMSQPFIFQYGGVEPLMALALCNAPLLQCEVALADIRVTSEAAHPPRPYAQNSDVKPIFETEASQIRHVTSQNIGGLIAIARTSLLAMLLWAQYEASRAIAALSRNREYYGKLLGEGVLDVLPTVLRSHHNDVRLMGLRTVANLASHAAIHMSLAESIPIEMIVDAGHNDNSDIKRCAIQTIGKLSENSALTWPIIEAGGLSCLLEGLEKQNRPDVRIEAAKVLCTLANLEDLKTIICKGGILDDLTELVSSGHVALDNEIDPTDIVFGPKVKGGSTAVYRAIWLGQNVAVRVIDVHDYEFDIKQFRREVAYMSLLPAHEHIVEFKGVARTETHYYVVSEWVEPGCLATFLAMNEFDLEESLRLAMEIASAVDHLHQHDVAHLRLNSMTILVDMDRKVKLCDVISSKSVNRRVAWTAGVTKSFRTASPELLLNGVSGGVLKSDSYSLAVLLWELFAHDVPYEPLMKSVNSDFVRFAGRVSNSTRFASAVRPEIPKNCPAEAGVMIKECWRTDAEVRPSVKYLLQILEGIREVYYEHKAE
eukprot:GFYU01008429.1.p1 GENE.GFYU01008429.1~~GFYU01008429.1.p1  ORF type:complete len:1013 (-),score=190.68 GFYU01008429.1:85-3123(-)